MVQQKRLLHLALLLGGVTAAAACGAPPPAARTTVNIGVDLPAAGRDGGDGIMALRGIELAVAQINASTGRPLRFELVVRDTSRGGYQDPHVDEATDPIFDDAHGADDIRAFAADATMLGVLGPLESNVARAEIPIAARAGLALLSASARDDGLTKLARPSSFFRLCAPQSADGIGAAHAVADVGTRRAYVVDGADVRARDEAAAFVAAVRTTAIAIVGREPYSPDMPALLQHIRASGADTVIFFGPIPTGVLIMRPSAVAAVLAPSRVRFMADSGFLPPAAASPGRRPDLTDASAIWPDQDDRSKSSAAFEADFRRSYEVSAPPVAAAYYESALVLMESILSASAACSCTPSRPAVVQALRRYHDDDSIIGPISFTSTGERRSIRMTLVRIRGDSYIAIKELTINNSR